MKALVAGGTGFIGSHLAERLAGEGYRVVVPVRSGSGSKYPAGGGVEKRGANLADTGELGGLLEGVDTVFHLASIRGSGWGHDDETIRKVNVGLTRTLLDASVAASVRRFLYVSSVSVFGHPRGGPIGEDAACLPVTRYGKTKFESERLVRDYHEAGKISTTVLRPVITYGPRDTWGMIPKLVRLIDSGRYLTVGSGKNRVHLIYIDDLVDGIMLAAGNSAAEGNTYVLSGERPARIEDLVDIISSLLKKNVPRFRMPIGPALLAARLMEAAWKAAGSKREPFLTRDKIDIMCRDRSFSHEKAGKDLGFEPRVDYGKGLLDTIVWLRTAERPEPGNPARSPRRETP